MFPRIPDAPDSPNGSGEGGIVAWDMKRCHIRETKCDAGLLNVSVFLNCNVNLRIKGGGSEV